jgi:lipopolysaccharide/colanic/teichoic acid biosynthesis glycosyltransferase
MMKRTLDFFASLFGLLALSPILLPTCLLIWLQDFASPFYVAPRVGINEKIFQMVKLRSMVVNADKMGVDSTSADDRRITPIGHFVRRYKLDELTQLWNVLKGEMSLVGPRPNVKRDTDTYTDQEKKLLSVKPGITDLSSIVFSDEGEILKGRPDPDLAYNQLIRPWKSRLGLVYIEHQSLGLDVQLIILTIIAIISRPSALKGVAKILQKLGVDDQLYQVALRQEELHPFPPPGSDQVVLSRD